MPLCSLGSPGTNAWIGRLRRTYSQGGQAQRLTTNRGADGIRIFFTTLRIAKELGLTIPPGLLSIVDETIE
jgi:hypothetical protein